MKFRGGDQLFLVRKGLGRYLLAGGEISIAGCDGQAALSLVDPIQGSRHDERPASRLVRDTLTILLDGRQRLEWVELTIASP